ncbi:MAG: hypothetical protein JWN36_613 [Microbacteriaceae bacterium]|nr:hypothetical protein [Microbacteriaceae bacterium]
MIVTHRPLPDRNQMRRPTLLAVPALLISVLALAGCAAGSAAPTPTASTTASCDVKVVVDFGVLDKPAITKCADAGAASDVLASAGIATMGTDDYGNKVVCRVNDEPSPSETVTIPGQAPFVESCHTLNSVAYWALWVKPKAGAKWAYATKGVDSLQLTKGQSVGLVYTAGTDSTPPQG